MLPTSLGYKGKCSALSEVWGGSFSLLVGALDQESGDQGLRPDWPLRISGMWGQLVSHGGPQVSHLEVVHLLVSSQLPVAHWLLTLAPLP